VLIWKDVLSPGEYWYMNAAGAPCKYQATAQHIRHMFDEGNKMLAAGLSIPIPLEHQPGAKPLNAAEKAANQLLNNAGWVKKYALKNDTLFSLCDIPDPKIAAKLPRTIKFTSPHIDSFTDGDGRKWEGVISHLALTSRPRITRQQPFGDVAAALSHVQMATSHTGLALSRAGLLRNGQPAYPKAFSVWANVTLAMPEPPAKKEETPPEKKPEEKEGIVKPDESAMQMLGEAEEDMDLVDVVCDLMSIYGVELPEGTEEGNLLQNLLRALMDHMKSEAGNDMPGSDTMKMGSDSMNTAGTKSSVVEAPPLYMSLTQATVDAITDPDKKALANALFSMQQQDSTTKSELASLKKKTLDEAFEARGKKIALIGKRVAQATREKIEALHKLPQMAFSLGGDGNLVDPMQATLDILDSGLRDLPALLSNPSGAQEQKQPLDVGDGRIDEGRRKQAVDELGAAAGLAKAS
jgi:hypothetical protein